MDIIKLHDEGLSRVVKIIDSASDYDKILEHRIGGAEWQIFSEVKDVNAKIEAAIGVFEKKFINKKYKSIVPSLTGIVFDGSTKNNIREFEFFIRSLDIKGIDIKKQNYAFCETVTEDEFDSEKKELQSEIFESVLRLYKSRNTITASLVRQQILYSQSFFSYLLAFKRNGACIPAVLVQANDHSPARVAMSMIMKFLKVPRVYLQHAEVTSSFPNLDFDISILRNQKSYDSYVQAGPIIGKVFILSREESLFQIEKLYQVRNTGVKTVIYPTSRIDRASLSRVVVELEKNPNVAELYIKPHPDSVNLLSNDPRLSHVKVLSQTPDFEHIALVGNSSVAVELLHKGIPVYQNFEFDPVQPDYYKLCSDGITLEVSSANLKHQFWKPYPLDFNWFEKYSKLDPSAQSDGTLVLNAFRSAFNDLLTQRENYLRPIKRSVKGQHVAKLKASLKIFLIRSVNRFPRTSEFFAGYSIRGAEKIGRLLLVFSQNAKRYFDLRTNIRVKVNGWATQKRKNNDVYTINGFPSQAHQQFLIESLCEFDSTNHWIYLNLQSRMFSPHSVISTFENLFENRSNKLNLIFEKFTFPLDQSQLDEITIWVFIKKVLWGDLVVAKNEISAVIYASQHCVRDKKVRTKINLMILSLLMREADPTDFLYFWSQSGLHYENLSCNRKIEVLRWVDKIDFKNPDLLDLKSDLLSTLTDFESLKWRNAQFLDGLIDDEYSHRTAAELFTKVAPKSVSIDFEEHALKIYERLANKMLYMELRSRDTQRQMLLDVIKDKLVNREQFSILRLSDGEGYLFDNKKFFTNEDIANRERHWWGLELDSDLRQKIISAARLSLFQADIIGIPSVYRFIRDCSEKSRLLAQNIQGRGLLEVLNGIEDSVHESARFTEDKVNVALFGDVRVIRELAGSAVKVIVVSSALPERVSAVFPGIALDFVPVTTHFKTSLNKGYIVGEKALPFVYEESLHELNKLVVPGALVLVAAGIVGKIFIGHCRSKGAVVLDIGHTLDDWVADRLATMR